MNLYQTPFGVWTETTAPIQGCSPSWLMTYLLYIPKRHPHLILVVNLPQLLPGTPGVLNYAGAKNGTAYLDDFENSQSDIDLKSANAWQISGTPQQFPESQLLTTWLMVFIVPVWRFITSTRYFIHPLPYRFHVPNCRKPYVREVLQTEVFPYQQSVTGSPLILPTLDLAYYPMVRGPYNYVPAV